MPHRNLLLLLAAAVVSFACYVRAEQNPYARYIASGYSVIDQWSWQEVPDQELFEGAMRGMIGVLRKSGDEHSAFVNEKQRDRFREELTQQFGGVGVLIRALGESALPTVVGAPMLGTPAFRSDLRSGDQILAIDGQSTSEVTMKQVLKLMRGPVGEPVTLAIRHLGETTLQSVALTRAMIAIDSIYGDLRNGEGRWRFRLEDDRRVGYVRIISFGDKTVEELTRVLAELTAPGQGTPIEALILDVRDNAGGALDAAVGISELFLRAGQTIVTTRGRDQETRDRFVSTGNGGYTEIPLAVLINHNSASASEILAACLQDYGRATVLGRRSYGKGTVQRLLGTESGRSLLKLTTATYWRPSEQNIHRMPGDTEQATWGVQPGPGFAIEQSDEQYLQWRRHRSRRDLLGTQTEGRLAKLLDEAEQELGNLPKSFSDRVLQHAVEHLVK